MSARQKRKLYCVWKNSGNDAIVAIDETAERCAELMNVSIRSFYANVSRGNGKWTIIRANEIKETEEMELT